MDEQEEWRDVVGYPGYEHYQVSSLGRVRNNKRSGKVMKPRRRTDGYLQVIMCAEGAQKTARVNRLVALAFHGLPPEGHETAHKDGTRTNNRADNLTWKTRRENIADKADHGTFPAGDRKRRRLYAAGIAEIRRLGLSVPSRVLAARYGVRPSTISSIRNNPRYPNLTRQA